MGKYKGFLKIFFIPVSLIVFFHCSEKTIELNETEKSILMKIEEENQKIIEFLQQTNSGMPDMQGISTAVKNFIEICQPSLQSTARNLQNYIQSIQRKNIEKDFQNYSDFSLLIFPLIRKAEIPNVFKFYCPMTKKYWIARGKKINNPYSPDMRTCGELIIE